MRKILLYITILTFLFPSSAIAGPEGVWLARDGKAHVKVKKCKTGLCANIVWLKQPNDENGKPLRDQNNPNTSLKSRPIMGLPLFVSMQPTSSVSWEGKVYDPEQGGIFRGFVNKISNNQMKVKGCLSMGWPCKTYMWKRIK